MAEPAISTPILRTKLHRPPVPADLVPRVDLLRRLEQGCGRTLTLVSAPAGYGKSILVSSWLENCECPAAWVSLDGGDNELRQFLSYFLATVETLFPDAVRQTRALVEAPTLPPQSRLAAGLINELDRIDQPFIVVLDDVHRIREQSVHDLLAEMLRHPPPSLHLVLAGRSDPPLPLSSLRALGQLNEVRFRELCFTPAETAAFLRHVLGVDVDAATAAGWQEKTEGWPAALRFAALALGREGNVGNLRPAREWGTHEAREFLFEEVLSRQPPGVRRRLLKTAILNRFCAPLCDAVEGTGGEPEAGEMSGWEFIARLNQGNVFVIPLDTDNRWFRYHHLFQQLLRNQLERHASPEEIHALHARAREWFEDQGLMEEALHHALAGGAPEAAAGLVARHGFELTNDEQWPRLERWLGWIPRDIVDQDPGLLLLGAWLHTVNTNPTALATCLQRAEALLSAAPHDSADVERFQSHLDALRGYRYYVMASDGERASASARRACESLPLRDRWARTFALTILAVGRQMAGDLPGSLSVTQEAMADETLRGAASQGYLLATPCFVHWIAGDLAAMRLQAAYAVKYGENHGRPETVAHGSYFLCVVHYEQNALDAAETSLVELVGNPYTQHALNFAHSAFMLALIHQSRDRTDEADTVAESVVAFALDTGNTAVLQLARAFQAELALRQGRLAEASQWTQQYVAQPFVPRYRFYVPQLTMARVLLAQETTGSRAQAADLLDSLHEYVVRTHNIRFQIDVLALQALLCDARGDEPSALEKLSASLALAEPGGFIRAFVDLGPQLAELLTRLTQHEGVSVEYVERILTAFPEDERAPSQRVPDRQTTPSPAPAIAGLAEPLTNRELDILLLLEQRKQNKEIAEELVISTETVKTHLRHFFRKLGVDNRREAVAQARDLGILPQR